MHIDTTEMIDELLESLSKVDGIHPEDVPNIDLYMDQVTTFMDAHLESSKRYQEDKILTKTMINNYAKNHLLPPPEKKKYSKEHMLILIFIYYLKSILSINDIQTLLEPITDKYFHSEEGFSITVFSFWSVPKSKRYGKIFSKLSKWQRPLSRTHRRKKRIFSRCFLLSACSVSTSI